MAITRSVWIDDDGSGTTGTILNNSELQTIYDNIDAGVVATAITSAATGTLNDWAPPGLGRQPTTIFWTGNAPSTLTGLRFVVEGQVITIKNRSTNGSTLSLLNYSASSATQNRLINIVGSAATPIAMDGAATYIYQGGVWFLIAHEQGAWITPPFSAADYTGWTVAAGHVIQCKYRLSGRTLHVLMYVNNASTAGGAGVGRAVPGGFSVGATYFPYQVGFIDTAGPGTGWGQATGTTLAFYKNGAAAGFAAGTISVNVNTACEIT